MTACLTSCCCYRSQMCGRCGVFLYLRCAVTQLSQCAGARLPLSCLPPPPLPPSLLLLLLFLLPSAAGDDSGLSFFSLYAVKLLPALDNNIKHIGNRAGCHVNLTSKIPKRFFFWGVLCILCLCPSQKLSVNQFRSANLIRIQYWYHPDSRNLRQMFLVASSLCYFVCCCDC